MLHSEDHEHGTTESAWPTARASDAPAHAPDGAGEPGVVRAVVLIGVARTGGRFPELQAVPGALAAVRDWAALQGVPDDLVLTFADTDGGTVTTGDVLAGVRRLLDRGDVDQLVVYFSGHGINTGNAEFWLLPGAPEDGSQAVNVSLTSWYAERLPVRHVVLVSDACRTAASTVQELSVQGVAVVPNLPPRGPAAAVDVFYACALGDPAYEVKDPATSGAAYQALFTTVLVAALRGDHPALVTGGDGPAAAYGLVQPWPLKRALPTLVADRLTAMHAPLDLAQTPDARLSSDPTVAWLSRLEPWPAGAGVPAGPGLPAGAGLPAGPGLPAGTGVSAGTTESAGTELFVPEGAPPQPPSAVVGTSSGEAAARTPATAVGALTRDAAVAAAADRLAASLAVGARLPSAGGGVGGTDAGGTGGRVGAGDVQLEVAVVSGPRVVVHGDEVVRVDQVTSTAAVVTLASGGCVVLPTLPGRITLATVEDGHVVDCALARAGTDGSGRDEPRAGVAAVGRSGAAGPLARRALTAAWSRFGLTRDEPPEGDPDLAADPLEAVYRAWDLHDRGRRAELAALARGDGPAARLFDVLLLAGGPDLGDLDDPGGPDGLGGPGRPGGAARAVGPGGRGAPRVATSSTAGPWAGLLTPVPLLARGWALLPGAPAAVRDAALAFPARLPSHWTLFAAADAPRVVAAVAATAPDRPEESS